ncbi:hypothetical protein ABEO98_22655 [Brevibacillus parabrevis]|uniref:hypothetical protein n=1 Tax=Brevibacillus parabrevis TaxID=54914 RepID=UPI003D1E4E90
MELENLPERKRVLVKVIKEIGYHDVHFPDEIIWVFEEHAEDMVKNGFVETVLPQ